MKRIAISVMLAIGMLVTVAARADVVAAMKAASVHASLKVADKDLKEIAEWIQKL